MSARSLLAPEVIQTSAMDCGPASLKCLLDGFGLNASYGRLREACQTDVDGTSIDTLEDIACELGLDAQQVMVPPDFLLLPSAALLPALVVVTLPNGFAHFVVVWRTHGALVQVMDPAGGRRFPTRARLLEQLFVHTQRVEAADWREYAGSEDFLRPLGARIDALGAKAGAGWKEAACADPGWRSLATLDAGVRFASSLVQSGALRRGREASDFVGALLASARKEPAQAEQLIPAHCWSVRPLARPPEPGAAEALAMRGAVLLQVKGLRRAEPGVEPPRPASAQLAAVLTEPRARPLATLLSLVREDGLLAPAALAVAALAAAGITLLEGLLLRALIDSVPLLSLGLQRGGAVLAVAAFLGLALLVELTTTAGLRASGRHLEARFRMAFLRKVPRIGDRYFHSRLISDMASRAHAMSVLRTFPSWGGQLLRSGAELVAMVAGIAWMDPASAPAVAGVAVACVLLPALAQRWLSEQEMRLRIHSGVLSRFYLDALLGLFPIRAHGAEQGVRAEHEAMLVEWGRTGGAMRRLVVALQGMEGLLGAAAAVLLVTGYLQRSSDTGAALLLVYWTLNIPVLGTQIATLLQQLPGQRNAALRILEPLGAPDEDEEEKAPAEASPEPDGGASLDFQGVRVVAAGNVVLDEVSLRVEPGSHVAIVGPSGAGKSTLLGLLLGWHRPAAGALLVDGAPLSGGRLALLRRQTAWVDPEIQLWNRTLIENLHYGQRGEPPPLGAVIEGAELRSVLERLPDGLQTQLGEGGGLVSGGEGQRVRLGRALVRGDARLVLLDEPFRGMERAQRTELLRHARAHWPRATLLCVTHDVEHALEFERVVVVEAGRVAEDGRPSELAAREGSRFRALLDAERAVRRSFWDGARWRRLQLAGGRLQERGEERG